MTKIKKPDLKNEKKTEIVAANTKVNKKKLKNKAKAVKKIATPKEIVNESTTTTLTDKDKLKIEKKKAKKLAQKLKKKLHKQNAAEQATDGGVKSNGTENGNATNETTKNVAKPKKTKKAKKVETKQPTDEEKIKEQKKLVKKGKTQKIDKVDREPRERDPAIEAATVFVGNLPINTKRVQLVRLFKDFCVPKSIRLRTAGGKVLFKHKQRKSAASLNAYVVLDSADVVAKAISLNGTEFKGNTLRVTRSGKEAVTAAEDDAKRTIFVGNLKYTATEDKLREIFSSCGDIEYIRCLQDSEKGCKGVAYVCFKAADAVGLALELKETILDERPINVERYSTKKLGAKAARDASAAASGATKSKPKKTGAQKRIDKKQKPKNASDNEDPTKKKKSEFRGVKSDGVKKTNKKKKVSGALQKLAKKIAPKSK